MKTQARARGRIQQTLQATGTKSMCSLHIELVVTSLEQSFSVKTDLPGPRPGYYLQETYYNPTVRAGDWQKHTLSPLEYTWSALSDNHL